MILISGNFDMIGVIDNLFMNWTDGIRSPWLDGFFKTVTELGSPTAFILLAIVIFVYLFWKGKTRQGLIIEAGLISSWITMKYLKCLVGRERPPGEQLTGAAGFSFPSGHAMLAMTFYGFIAYLLLIHIPSKWGKVGCAAMSILILLIGFSRIYLNVHYFSDVLAGFVFGGIFLAIMIKTCRL